MVVKLMDNAKSFLDAYEAVLLENEAVSQLVLYNAKSRINSPVEEGGLYGAVVEEDKPILLFSNVMPYNMAIYVASQENAIHASVALADFLGISNVNIEGINARQDICHSFMEQYQSHISCSFAEILGMDIMEIRSINEVTPIEGEQRLATPEEAKLVTDWIIQSQMETKTSEMDYEAALDKAKQMIVDKKIFLYETREQEVVSMAVADRQLVHGVAITYIFTPEEHRGKGYAAANIYYLSKSLLEQGNEFCTLFVDKKNPLSERAYEKVGYQCLADNYEYKVIPVEA